MTKKKIEFNVTPGDGVQGFWIAVSRDDVLDVTDVKIENLSASIQLETRKQYILYWWFVGNPGNSLKIVGIDGFKEIVTVKNSRIPSEEIEGGGRKRFEVT